VAVGPDVVHAFAGISQYLPDGQAGETPPEALQAGDGLLVSIGVGGDEGGGQGPEDGEVVVDDVEGIGLVSEVMFAAGGVDLV